MSPPPGVWCTGSVAVPQRAEVLRAFVRADCGPLREAACASTRLVCDTWWREMSRRDSERGTDALAIDYADWLRKANRDTPLRLWPKVAGGCDPDALRTGGVHTPKSATEPPIECPVRRPVEWAPRVSENVPKIGDLSPIQRVPESVRLRVVTITRAMAATGRLIDLIA